MAAFVDHVACTVRSEAKVAPSFQMPVQAALDAVGINPDANPIKATQVSAVLTQAFGFEPILHCSYKNGDHFLNEVQSGNYMQCMGCMCVFSGLAH